MFTPQIIEQMKAAVFEEAGIDDIKLAAMATELLAACEMASDFLNYGEAMHSSKLVYDRLEEVIEKAKRK